MNGNADALLLQSVKLGWFAECYCVIGVYTAFVCCAMTWS